MPEIYKLAFIGDPNVGKTSLIINSFSEVSIDDEEEPTTEIEYIPFQEDKNHYSIFDVPGSHFTVNWLDQLKTHADLGNHHNNADFLKKLEAQECKNFVLVIDQTNKHSLENAPKWIEQVRNKHKDAMIVVALSKTDAADKQVTLSDLETLVNDHHLDVPAIETSAKNSQGISKVIEIIRKKNEDVTSYKEATTNYLNAQMPRLNTTKEKTKNGAVKMAIEDKYEILNQELNNVNNNNSIAELIQIAQRIKKAVQPHTENKKTSPLGWFFKGNWLPVKKTTSEKDFDKIYDKDCNLKIMAKK